MTGTRLLLLGICLAFLPAHGSGQAREPRPEFYPVDARTGVSAVAFEFGGNRTLPTEQLRAVIALKDPRTFRKIVRGLRGRGTGRLGREDQPFDPGEMVRDLERLRRLYRREGFPDASVDFELTLDEEANTAAVTYLIEEGQPLRVRRVSAVDSTGVDLPQRLPPEVRQEWESSRDIFSSFRGVRLSEKTLQEVESRVSSWLGDRGYGFARASAYPQEPSPQRSADVRLVVSPGPRLRVQSIQVRETKRLDRRIVLDELPFREGDWLSTGRLVEGRRELMGLPMVRFALVDFVQVDDSNALVEVQVEEGPLRLVTGELGYESRTGPSLRGSWTHRDFMGGARSLTLQLRGQLGDLALVQQPDRLLRISASLRDPRLFDRRTSWTTSVFGELSEDPVFKARRAGVENLLLFAASQDFSVNLNVSVARRWIDEYRFAVALEQGIDYLDLLVQASQGLAEELGDRQNEGDIALEAIIGHSDPLSRSPFSWSLRPRIGFSAPRWASDIQYVRLDGVLEASKRLGSGIRLAARAGGGHLKPYGASLPKSEEEETGKLLELRRVLFTAGGSSDVRGWGAGLLGPKFPELILRSEGDSIRFDGQGFSPLGGTNKLMVSLQAESPLPFGPGWLDGFVFLDGGRIWNDNPSLGEEGKDPLGQERFFWAAGGGVVVASPVGRIEVALGVKLNPTVIDLASPGRVLRAILDEEPLEDLPTRDRRRLQLHVSLGVGR